MFLSGLIPALKFLYYSQSKHELPRQRREVAVTLPQEKIPIHIYTHPKKYKTTRGTILIIHGMTPQGYEDIRIIKPSNILAHCGYTVVVPFFKNIADLNIRQDDILTIIGLIKYIIQDKTICPSQKLGMISGSFSSGYSIIAASDPDISGHISTILTNGAYCNVDTTIRFLFSYPEVDKYGLMVILKNFIESSIGKNPALIKALEIAAHDNVFLRNPPELPTYLETISKKDRNFFNKITRDVHLRLFHLERMIKKSGTLIKELSVSGYIPGIKAAMALIHSKEDKVIPPEESIRIYNTLKKFHKKARIVVSSLVTHAGRISLSMIVDAIKLLLILKFYFKNI